MTYVEAIQFLSGLQKFGARFGLETTRQLASAVGNPHARLRFIHVAGTNGKGSTCAMLESIYRAGGLRVGLFTSPHLVSFRERLQINRQMISEADVSQLVEATARHVQGTEITFFEFVTVMALQYFAEQKCDLVIWETGLGGRLDATNIVTPLASVITNIGFDHQQWLGDTLAKIAREKAGIIKLGVPVITAADDTEALTVITETASESAAPLSVVDSTHTSRLMQRAVPSLAGEHQKLNAALAVQTVEVLQNTIPVSEAVIRQGLESVNWSGRLQLITRPNGQHILLDGAHNIPGIETLRAALLESDPTLNLPQTERALILGVMQDKDWRTICELLAPLAHRVVIVPVGSERSASPEVLVPACRQTNPSTLVSSAASLVDAVKLLADEKFIVVTGSLYLVGEALALIGSLPDSAGDERALNNWQPTARTSPKSRS